MSVIVYGFAIMLVDTQHSPTTDEQQEQCD